MQSPATDNVPQIPDDHTHAHKVDFVPDSKNPTPWWIFVQQTSGDAKQQDIANKVGIDQSHISRWKQGYPPGVPFVVKFAEAYGRSVLEALVAAEIITAEQAQLHEVRVVDPDQMTDEELLEAVQKRMRRRG